MFGLSLLNAAFLLGLAAVAVPVIIHLIHKRRSKSVDFPSLMFLRIIDLRVASRQRLRELLVLALRIAAIALFAFALAKPILRTRTASAGSSTSTTAVIIIDNSYSMGYKESGVSGVERAREKALEVLSTLGPADSAALIPVAGCMPADARLSRDLAGLTHRVGLIKERPAAGSLEGAIELATKALKESTEINRELYIISDYQLLLWAPVLAGETLKNIEANLVVVDIAEGGAKNLALTLVQLGRRPGVAGALEIEVQARNYCDTAMNARVALILEGRTRSEKPLTVPPGGSASVAFFHSIGADRLQGHAFLQTDGLAADNKRFFTTRVGEAVPVLVVNGDPSDIWDLDEAFYLATALAPRPSSADFDAGSGELISSSVRPRVVTAGELRHERLTDYAVVVLSNVPAIDEVLIADIEEYVRGGGGLVIFCGDLTLPAYYNRELHDSARTRLLPCRLLGRQDYPQSGATGLTMTPADWDHPVFSALKGVRDLGFSTTRFSKIMVCEQDSGDKDVRVLARFSTGKRTFPALLERKIGAGSVLFFASTCDRDWTNMPLRPIYLPLMHQMISYLTTRSSSLRSYLVGEPVKYTFPPALKEVEVTVTDPAGRAAQAKVEPAGEATVATFTGTTVPGIYSARVKTGSGREDRFFAVNVDTSESDLTRVAPAEAKEAFGPDVLTLGPADDLAGAIWRMRTGVKLWDYFFYLALLALLAEGWLANRFVPHRAEKTTHHRDTENKIGDSQKGKDFSSVPSVSSVVKRGV